MALKGRSVPLDELPRHSPWPARLLGAERADARARTEKGTFKQWEDETFGPLLRKLQREGIPPTVENILARDAASCPEQFAYADGEFLVAPLPKVFYASQEVFSDFMARFLPCRQIVEMGAGSGRRSLLLAKDARFSSVRFTALEYTPGGRELIRQGAAAEGVEIETGPCDFFSHEPASLSLDDNAVIFTSYAMHYVPWLSESFFRWLGALEPALVVHFEPFYGHIAEDTLFGLLRRRYIEFNDYNRNAITLLHSMREAGELEIVAEEEDRFGSNALLVGSLVAWRPASGMSR